MKIYKTQLTTDTTMNEEYGFTEEQMRYFRRDRLRKKRERARKQNERILRHIKNILSRLVLWRSILAAAMLPTIVIAAAYA